MKKEEIQNLIKELIEKTTLKLDKISIIEESPTNTWFSVEVSEPHFFMGHEGEALYSLNHLVRRIVEAKTLPTKTDASINNNILIDINGFQKKQNFHMD